MLLKLAKNIVGRTLTAIGNRLTDPPPALYAPTPEPEPEAPKKERPPYNPRVHPTFKLIAPTILANLLANNEKKNVSTLVRETGDRFAQSTVRSICKELVKDGLLEQIGTHAVSFIIPEGAEERVKQFLTEFPPSPNPETPLGPTFDEKVEDIREALKPETPRDEESEFSALP